MCLPTDELDAKKKDWTLTPEEYEKAFEECEKAWRDEPMKAFPLSEEEIEQLKKEGRI